MAQESAAPGRFQFQLHRRVFDTPLFGDYSTTTFSLFATQHGWRDSLLTLYANGGSADYANTIAFEAAFAEEGEQPVDRVRLLDFSREAPRAETSTSGLGDSYPLRGIAADWSRGTWRFDLLSGEAKYFVQRGGREEEKPWLTEFRALREWNRSVLGLGAMSLSDASYLDGSTPGSVQIASAVVGRDLRRRGIVLGEAWVTVDGDIGIRGGYEWRRPDRALRAAAYSFGEGFPYLFPLFRPGETGIDLAGHWNASEFSTLGASVNLIADEALAGDDRYRYSLEYSRFFGSNLPRLFFTVQRNQVVVNRFGDADDEALIADRVALFLNQSTFTYSANLTLEHLANTGGGQPDRSQLVFYGSRVLSSDVTVFGESLLQKQPGSLGATGEVLFEIPWRPPWFMVAGAGAAYRDADREEAGEGVLRVGAGRRMRRYGWYVRAEWRTPFSIGLERSNLLADSFTLDLGTTLGWRDARSLRGVIDPYISPGSFGSISGRVLRDGAPARNVRILVDGQPAATTGRDGVYVVRRVRNGPVEVSVDLTNIEVGYSVVGDSVVTVVVGHGLPSEANFELRRFSVFQGAVVCEGVDVRPVRQATLLLTGPAGSLEVLTSSVGGFQTDQVPPGIYELRIDPRSVIEMVPPDNLPVSTIDLTGDVLGHVIRLRCNP